MNISINTKKQIILWENNNIFYYNDKLAQDACIKKLIGKTLPGSVIILERGVENQSDIKSKLTEFYKSYTQQEQMRLHRHEKLKNQRRLMVLTGGFVALMSSTIILYHKSKRRKLRLEEEIESERRIHKMQQKALSGKLKNLHFIDIASHVDRAK